MTVSRWLTRMATPRGGDILIAVGLLFWGLPNVPWWWERQAGSTPQILGALTLSLTMSVPFLWRRSLPLLAFGLALVVFTIRAALHIDLYSALGAVLIGGYGLGAYSATARPYARWLGWVLIPTAVVVVALNENRLLGAPPALLAAALLAGDAAGARRAETAAKVEAADQAERSRIARDLHDLVAHQLSAIAMQAGAGRMALAAGAAHDEHGDGAQTQRSHEVGQLGTPAELLALMEQLAREALVELNHLLGALRREPTANPARPPAPTLADIPALVGQLRDAGLPVNVITEGQGRPLPPGLELAGYRIIAEALANVGKHAPAASTRVAVRYRPEELEIQVRNRPSASPPGRQTSAAGKIVTGGHGLQGMRERAELYGGRLEAGPMTNGGFEVRAAIPYDECGRPDGGPTL